MNKPDYTNLDGAILAALRSRPMTFTGLLGVSKIKEAAKTLEDEHKQRWVHSRLDKPAFRFLDSRMQALRKAGKIRYATKTGWSIVDGGR